MLRITEVGDNYNSYFGVCTHIRESAIFATKFVTF